MHDNVMRFDYKDTDKKTEIDIYGLRFEVSGKIEDLDIRGINEDNNLEDIIEEVLGKGAVDKINNKRVADGYPQMDTQVELAVIMCAVKSYVKSAMAPIDDLANDFENTANRMSNIGNREQRRNYNRRYGRNDRYRRY